LAVFVKDESYIDKYKNRMIDELSDYAHFFNGFRFPKNERFPDGWDTPKAEYHQATKKTFVIPYKNGIIY